MASLFSPPLHRQRHQFIIDFVKRDKPKKVVDLGCSKCCLIKNLRFHREIELLVGVDINLAKVTKKMHELAPLSTEYLQPRCSPLSIELYQGSVTEKDARLRGFDLLTSVELIEHLPLADVERFSEVVFGYMTPVSVIISTPNSEFNPLLPGLTGFRHSDHKFEWTRAEFQSWAMKVCEEFGYEVQFTGVGQAPPVQQERVGFCSQIAVFQRRGGRLGLNVQSSDDPNQVFSYKLLYSVTYPSLRDNNILRRVLVCEVLYWAEKLKRGWMEKKTDGGDETYTLSKTLSKRRFGFENMHERLEPDMDRTCEEETKTSAGRCEGAASEDEEGVYEEAFWTDSGGQETKQRRYVSCVPLALLCSSCPKVSSLSGSLTNLRHLLLDEPSVTLTQDGSAVRLMDKEQEQEEADNDDLEDSGYTEMSHCSLGAVQEEDWEADL
ncbi:small RNA 2'-O-methyltransferase [Genypterus blacodes]|uniref:small RNA 2'-O-methyltransferase n=1 Tax=Genypterus blacodes TaxID=154954 RepID=UPI003F75C813